MRIMIGVTAAMFLASTWNAVALEPVPKQFCEKAQRMFADTNAKLPAMIDKEMELLQVVLNCVSRIVKYKKRILTPRKDLPDDWKTQTQRRQIKIHCMEDRGLAQVYNLSVIDQFYYQNYSIAAEITTHPSDCRR